MTVRHTRGPWEYAHDRVYYAGREIASLLSSAPSGMVREANARLIAAAPEMAEALLKITLLYLPNSLSPLATAQETLAAAQRMATAALKAAGVLP